MECGALCSIPKSKEAFATVWNDEFEITPLDPRSRCTTDSLAAHTLYEKARSDILMGPGGGLNVTKNTYRESGSASCIGSGATFEPANPYTIKLEGAKVSGYRTIFIGSIRDPIMIAQIDSFLAKVRKHVTAGYNGVPYDLRFHVYGKDGTMGPFEKDLTLGKELCLVGDVKADTQAMANSIASSARIAVVHGPYPHQKATAGNFAMPFSPLEVPLGQVCEFNVYHLIEIDDPIAFFPRTVQDVGSGFNTTRYPTFGLTLSAPYEANGEPPQSNGHHMLNSAFIWTACPQLMLSTQC